MNFNFFPKLEVATTTKKLFNLKFYNIFLIIFLICCLYSFWALSIGWNRPILDLHGFRQTQTAISTYFLIQGSSWLAYETPVFAAP